MRTDDEILDGLRAREDWAAEVVRERITPLVRSRVYAFPDWEDVRQGCLLNVLKTVRAAGEIENLWGLVRRVTICHMIDHNRRHQLSRTIFSHPGDDPGAERAEAAPNTPEGAADPAAGLDERLADQELFAYVFQRLGQACQQLFRALFLEERTFEEAADEIGIARANLRVRLKRCRDRAVALRDQAL
ncbi:MAG: hypothetical protein OEO21_04410 [Candidatus Krumholzibacteria bacterium]|nr:hypothetical protein [Candidatus Krumholzibacteria bacterium]